MRISLIRKDCKVVLLSVLSVYLFTFALDAISFNLVIK